MSFSDCELPSKPEPSTTSSASVDYSNGHESSGNSNAPPRLPAVTQPSPPSEPAQSRTKKACNRCRIKKMKCTGRYPCTRCEIDKTLCTMDPRSRLDSKVIARGYISTLESQVAFLLNVLQQLRRIEPNNPHVSAVLEQVTASGFSIDDGTSTSASLTGLGDCFNSPASLASSESQTASHGSWLDSGCEPPLYQYPTTTSPSTQFSELMPSTSTQFSPLMPSAPPPSLAAPDSEGSFAFPAYDTQPQMLYGETKPLQGFSLPSQSCNDAEPNSRCGANLDRCGACAKTAEVLNTLLLCHQQRKQLEHLFMSDTRQTSN